MANPKRLPKGQIAESRADAKERGLKRYQGDPSKPCPDCGCTIRLLSTAALDCPCTREKKNAQARAQRQAKTGPKRYKYLSNHNFLRELEASHKKGHPTEELSKMFIKLCEEYSNKYNFRGYTFREDMVGNALLSMVTYWDRFDSTRSKNPFAYFTQIAKNSFVQTINNETKHYLIRDDLLVESGAEPSHNYEERKKADKKRRAKVNNRAKQLAKKKKRG